MERFRRRACWEAGMTEGRARVRKWVRSSGMRVGRRANQWAERRVRRRPFEGMPWAELEGGGERGGD